MYRRFLKMPKILFFNLLYSLIVHSPPLVTVTWSAAVHVIGQTPVLRLWDEITTDEKQFSTFTHTHTGFEIVPDTDHSCVLPPDVCRNTFLSVNHRSFLQAQFPVGYRYTLTTHTHTHTRCFVVFLLGTCSEVPSQIRNYNTIMMALIYSHLRRQPCGLWPRP